MPIHPTIRHHATEQGRAGPLPSSSGRRSSSVPAPPPPPGGASFDTPGPPTAVKGRQAASVTARAGESRGTPYTSAGGAATLPRPFAAPEQGVERTRIARRQGLSEHAAALRQDHTNTPVGYGGMDEPSRTQQARLIRTG